MSIADNVLILNCSVHYWEILCFQVSSGPTLGNSGSGVCNAGADIGMLIPVKLNFDPKFPYLCAQSDTLKYNYYSLMKYYCKLSLHVRNN